MGDVSEPTGAIVSATLERVIGEQIASSDRLGNQIWWLNVWLLAVTIAIFLLTAVQVWLAFRAGR